MSGFTLVIGNKSYSSWSLRPWLLMRHLGIAFDEILIPLYRADSGPRIRAYSPTGKVPCLIDDEIAVWESLAIVEHLAERFPAKGVWPQDPAAPAFSRAISAEMHAGFGALRDACTMNVRRKVLGVVMSDAVRDDVARIEAIWREARARFWCGGPFLLGQFSAADAMFAPVATRFDTYGIEVGTDTRSSGTRPDFTEPPRRLLSWRFQPGSRRAMRAGWGQDRKVCSNENGPACASPFAFQETGRLSRPNAPGSPTAAAQRCW